MLKVIQFPKGTGNVPKNDSTAAEAGDGSVADREEH